ncbi:hypothetical protein [Candidatus Lokiarchaeum ossiferum]|uniref:hypothetical protein n=1 Tax=Candidatus Lokiarchaeum ossiferum TaxID=2951803 RepID=UPI00352D5ACA
MQSSSYFQSTPNNFNWYQHHITPNWLFCTVNELEGFDDDGMIISKDLCESQNSYNAPEFSLEGKIRIQTITSSHEMWINYIATDILNENSTGQLEKDRLEEQFLFYLMPNLKLNNWLSEAGHFYSKKVIHEIINDHVYGQALVPLHIFENLKISPGDMIILRMDCYEPGNLDTIMKLENSCVWI